MKWQIIAEERLRNEVELASVGWMRRARSSNRIAGDCLSIFFWQLDQFDPALIRDASSHMFLASLDTHLVIRDSVGPGLTDQDPERQVKRCSCSSDWPTLCSGLFWSIWSNLCPPTYRESLPLTMLRLRLWLKVRKWPETVQYDLVQLLRVSTPLWLSWSTLACLLTGSCWVWRLIWGSWGQRDHRTWWWWHPTG